MIARTAVLTIHEIYVSVQGESTHVGRPCTFVRLSACDLRCSWCDTPYAFTGGRKMSVDEVLAEVERIGCPLVEITGGEPLLQKDVYQLMQDLLRRGYDVLLETGGHVPIDDVPDEVVAIVDVKCPASGEAARMHWPNLEQLSLHDEVKFVIQDRADFDYARRRAALPARRAHAAALFPGAGARAEQPRALDFSKTVCRSGSRFRRTSTSGARTRGACDGAPRRRPALRRARFDDRRRARAPRRRPALRVDRALRTGARV
jgi:7-carboxy-7-deazaguanine synthase